MTYAERAQERWDNMGFGRRAALLRGLGVPDRWAASFDLYGDMPTSVSDKLVQYLGLLAATPGAAAGARL